jgi:hypothetical protein
MGESQEPSFLRRQNHLAILESVLKGQNHRFI